MSGTDVLLVRRPADAVVDGVYTLGGQGNSLLVDHGEGLLLVDAGPGRDVTERMIAATREVSQKPLTHIVFSHGHMGYNFGIAQWRRHAEERGDPAPVLVAHDRVPVRYRRYLETAGLQALTNTRQFRTAYPADPPAHWFTMPEVTYRTQMRITGSQRDIVLFNAPSETDDATAVWLPGARILYGSCAFIKSCPNAGSPYRILRDPMRWAETLEHFQALVPHVLIPEFGAPLTKAADIEEALGTTIRAIHYLRREVVARMNRGMTDVEIVHDIDYPDALFGNRFMKPTYGCPEYLVREIWRTENGWWDRNPTHLHPAKPTDVAAEVLAAIGDPERVLAHAQALRDRGELQLAMHVVDLVALAAPRTPAVERARLLKAQLMEARADGMQSAVSRQIMRSEAEVLRGQEIGSSDRSAAGARFEWQ
ncbi:MAG: alkyl sulfatase dimerization domain-containing protein [Variovorax sp.]|nr:alkyl sulfatase dimerization domain-containing protein [Variovorax sp.]